MPTTAPVAHDRIPPRALVLLAVITLVWGTNWSLFPLVVREVSVWTFRAVGVFIAGITLLAVARARGLSLDIPRKHWATVGLATVCYLLLWNIASTYAATMIPSGQAAVLGFTMPLWAALIGWAVLGEKLGPRLLLALALGAAAVGLLAWRSLGVYAQAPLGVALGLLAGIGWAVGTLILKRGNVGVHPLVLSGWQLLVTAVPTAVGAWWLAPAGPWGMPSWFTIGLIVYIALVPMAIGNAAWFAIVGLLPASVAGLSAILVPVVAMVVGALLHGEPLGPTQWAAMACCAAALRLALVPPARA
ncbi:MAG: DMT family transporter [Aquabacterium sp.]|nr:DMT family transporter [Aquabacterium sp.]